MNDRRDPGGAGGAGRPDGIGALQDPMSSGVFKFLAAACPAQVWAALVCPERTARIFPGLSLVSTWNAGAPLEIRLPTQTTLNGQVLLAEPSDRLAFSIEDASGTTTYVSWTLRSHEAGCVVTLEVHDAGAEHAVNDELEDAWLPIVERLREVLTSPAAS